MRSEYFNIICHLFVAAAKENGRGGSASSRAGGGGEDQAGDAYLADARPGVGDKSEELEKREGFEMGRGYLQ